MNSIPALLAVALGGASGAIARYLVMLATAGFTRDGLPWGVLIANVTGCFAAGMVFVALAASGGFSGRLHHFFRVLGGYAGAAASR